MVVYFIESKVEFNGIFILKSQFSVPNTSFRILNQYSSLISTVNSQM